MRISALMVAALCVAGPAQAGGPVESIIEPAVEPAASVMAERNWTGFYAGVSAVSGTFDWAAIRLKLIGGYDAGRFLPYAFVGMTRFDVDQGVTFTDTMPNYGLGVRVALGSSGKIALGLEYLVESKDNFDNSGSDVKYDELSLRLDYHF